MKIIVTLLLGICLTLSLVWAKKVELRPGEVYLILNAPELDVKTQQLEIKDRLPRNWRTSEDPFLPRRKSNLKPPSTKGLSSLAISGSGAFTKNEFLQVLRKLKGKKVIVVDLRQESHGFVNDVAVSWYAQDNAINTEKSVQEIESDEKLRLSELKNQKMITLTKWIYSDEGKDSSNLKKIEFKIKPDAAISEKEFLTQLGIEYIRIPAPDYQPPRDQDVDLFISHYKKLKSEDWLHFHCAAGEGRTTTFMTMYDMMKNYKNVSASEIVHRQWAIGGLDLLRSKQDPRRNAWVEARVKFINRFYEYCTSEGPEFKKTWSEWNQLSSSKRSR
jgi:protein-tyrosine phosphatase